MLEDVNYELQVLERNDSTLDRTSLTFRIGTLTLELTDGVIEIFGRRLLETQKSLRRIDRRLAVEIVSFGLVPPGRDTMTEISYGVTCSPDHRFLKV